MFGAFVVLRQCANETSWWCVALLRARLTLCFGNSALDLFNLLQACLAAQFNSTGWLPLTACSFAYTAPLANDLIWRASRQMPRSHSCSHRRWQILTNHSWLIGKLAHLNRWWLCLPSSASEVHCLPLSLEVIGAFFCDLRFGSARRRNLIETSFFSFGWPLIKCNNVCNFFLLDITPHQIVFLCF